MKACRITGTGCFRRAHPAIRQTGRDEIEVQHTLPLSTSNRLVYGAAYRTDRSNGQGNSPGLSLAYSSSSRTNEYRVFAHDEWRITPRLSAEYRRDVRAEWHGAPKRIAPRRAELQSAATHLAHGGFCSLSEPRPWSREISDNRVAIRGRLYCPAPCSYPAKQSHPLG